MTAELNAPAAPAPPPGDLDFARRWIAQELGDERGEERGEERVGILFRVGWLHGGATIAGAAAGR